MSSTLDPATDFVGWFLDVSKRAHATARSKGWWDPCMVDGRLAPHPVEMTTWEKVALIHSELSEALEDLRVGRIATVVSESGKPEGAVSELADVVIRIGDFWGALTECELIAQLDEGVSTVLNDAVKQAGDTNKAIDPGTAITELHALLSRAFIAGRGPDHFEVLGSTLFAVAWYTQSYGDHLGATVGTTMAVEVEAKMAYNLTRSHRHGGKAF
jgi:hypothetical protein